MAESGPSAAAEHVRVVRVDNPRGRLGLFGRHSDGSFKGGRGVSRSAYVAL
jgi:hypothetical protein